MSRAEKAGEPSMDEILASIRKIISAEEPVAARASAGRSAGSASAMASIASTPVPAAPQRPAPVANTPTMAAGPTARPAPTAAPAAPLPVDTAAAAPKMAIDDMLGMADGQAGAGRGPSKAADDGAKDVPSWLFPGGAAKADAAPAAADARDAVKPFFGAPAPSASAAPAPATPGKSGRSNGDLGAVVPGRAAEAAASGAQDGQPAPSWAGARPGGNGLAAAPGEAARPQAARGEGPALSQLKSALAAASEPAKPRTVAPSQVADSSQVVRTVVGPLPVSAAASPTAVASPVAAASAGARPNGAAKSDGPAAKATEVASAAQVIAAPAADKAPAATTGAPEKAKDAGVQAAPPAPAAAATTTAVVAVADEAAGEKSAAAPIAVMDANVSAPKPAVQAERPRTPKASAPGELLPTAAPATGVRTLEDTVVDLLRPMIRQWLDDNMPRMVEKALRVEMAESVRAKLEGPRH